MGQCILMNIQENKNVNMKRDCSPSYGEEKAQDNTDCMLEMTLQELTYFCHCFKST